MDWSSLFFLIGNLAGFLLKKAPWYPTKFVPGAVFLTMALARLLAGLGIQTDIQSAAGVHFDYAGIAFGSILQQALMDTVKAVFAHTVTKNSIEGLRKK